MNDVYGIDPDAPSSIRDLVDLLVRFQPGQGRFIAAYPNNWTAVVGASTRWSDSQKQRATVFSELIKRVLIPVRAKEAPGASWSQNALHLKSCGVGTLLGIEGCAPPVVSLHDALEDVNAFSDARGDHVPREISAYIRTAEPLFKISTKVVLVDPFFGLWYKTRNGDLFPDRRRRQVLGALLKCAATFRKVVCFKVMLSETALPDDPNDSSFANEFSRIADEAGARDIALSYEVFEDHDGRNQHARYLLGNHNGLQFDHGFDIDSREGRKSKNHVHWMSESELAPLLDRFMVENAAPTPDQ